MMLLRNMVKLYRRNLFLSIFTCFLFTVLPLGVLAYYFIWLTEMPPVEFLDITLRAATLLPVIFIFLSYEYGYRLRASNLDECVGSASHGKLKVYGCQTLVLTLLAALLTIAFLCVHLFVYFDLKLDSPAYLGHMGANMVLYIFLPSLVGTMIGLAAAVRLKRMNAYLLLVVFAVLGASVLNKLFVGLYNDTGVDAFYFLDLFTINAPSLEYMPNAHFGYSLLSYQFQRIGFWVFGAGGLALLALYARKKSWLRGVAWACIAASVTCFVFYAQPASKVNMMLDHPHGAIGDRAYYRKADALLLEEDGGFNITNYQLQFTPGRELKAKAVLTVDQPDLAVYKFTLFHGYRVQSVQDQGGNDLTFEQKGDYITVQRGSTPVTQVQMKYRGYSKVFYANRQGMLLLPQAAFYPYSGYRTIIDEDRWDFVPVRLPETTKFSVLMDTRQKVYSNLSDRGDGVLEGQADSLLLMSGFLSDTEVDGVQVIYPYLETGAYSPEAIEKKVKEFLLAKKDDRTIKKMFVTPNVNLSENYTVMEDYLTAGSLTQLIGSYERALVPEAKRELYDTIRYYYSEPELYQLRLEHYQQASEAYMTEGGRGLLLFDALLSQMPEAELLTYCKQYFADGSDTRSVVEFLQSIGQEGA